MRPLRLDLAGFAMFRDECTIDFTDADFFALVGPTGSGKSTVLDAICFVLYGTVPRWGDRKAIANALAPSAAEARVRLVFESAGSRYVASRVVRRGSRGKVSTIHAGLELLPAGFDVSKFDTGLSPEDLGQVLAGTPSEMEQAVLAAVGLPYDQFTTCVVLPQGEFAEFLHAKPATRQQILVNLLGLDVYEQVRSRAVERAARADAELSAVDQVLASLSDVDSAAVAAAGERVLAMRRLAAAVDQAVPALRRAEQDAAAAVETLDLLDRDIELLERVEVPPEARLTAVAVAHARSKVDEASAAVAAAEEREEKLRVQAAEAPIRRGCDCCCGSTRSVRSWPSRPPNWLPRSSGSRRSTTVRWTPYAGRKQSRQRLTRRWRRLARRTNGHRRLIEPRRCGHNWQSALTVLCVPSESPNCHRRHRRQP